MSRFGMGLIVALLFVLGACSTPTGSEQPYPQDPESADDEGAS